MQQYKSVLLTTLFTILFISTWSTAQEPGGPYTTDDNTILLMHFDGNLTNNSTLSSDGVPTGSGMSYSSNSQTNLGQSLNFDGSSYITVPHNTNLNLSGDWTIEAWIKITAFNSNTQSVIVRKPGDTDDYYSNYTLELHPWWGNILHGFYFSNEQTRINVTEMSPTINKWYHVTYIRDVANSKISITVHDEDWNEVSSNSQNYSGTDVLLNSKDLRIGEAFEGYIDELRISNVVRNLTPLPFPAELDQAIIEKKLNALNLHRMKYDSSPYSLTIDVLSSAEYETQKPSDALSFDCGYVSEDGWVYVSEPTTTEQMEVFADINQAAIYYMCQSFLQYYYQATEMPIWFKTGFAAYESDMRFDDNDIKTAYNNYGGTLTSFDVLNNSITFVANNGLAISYMFGEFIGVFKVWSYNMVREVNASTIVPESAWYNAGTIEDLFDYFMVRYFNVRILETNELERLKLGQETEHFKHYYRDAEDYWLAHYPDILEEAITEYIGLMDFETFEKFSSLTMPICNYVTIGGGDCVNLRYTSGTAWSSGIWASSPDTDNANDIERFEHLIRHELAHLVQEHLPAKNMTAWLNEGYAEFMSRGPSTQEEKDALLSSTENALNNAISYFGHLPTFEDTKVYPGQTNVDYYLLGQIMLNFIYDRGGYSAVKDVMLDHETGISNMGFASTEDFMAAYYNYVNREFLKIIPQNGTLSNNILIESTNLGYSCQYRVYIPASNYSLSDLPTIYVTDGQNYLSNSMGKMVTTLDNLIANEIIKPVIAVFLDPRDPNNLSYDRRAFEYRNNMNFVNYVTQELIPVIDANYNTDASASARGIMGASYGGYNAEYFSVKASNYFNLFGMNSAYLHPNDNYDIDADLQAANLDGMKLYLSYGTSDADGKRYFDRLKGIFDSKGIVFESDIVSGGHDWGTWNKVVDKALYYFFPNSSNGNPPFLTDIPNILIFEGKLIRTIKLDDYVTDSDNEDSEITWTYSGNDKLLVEIDGNRIATISPIDINWFGNEIITFIAQDPNGNSNSDDVKIIIVPVNDYPIITDAPELIEFVSDTSFTVDIWDLVSDVETVDDLLTYEFSVDTESILFSYDDGTGVLTLSADLQFEGEGDLIWSVSDSEEIVKDTIHIAVEKPVIIGVNDEMIIPDDYVLHQNYPNPFNPTTMVKYGIPEQSNIKIEVFNMLGQSVGLLVDGNKSAGYYETTWNADNLPSGIYLVSIRAKGLDSKKNFRQVKKALLLK